MQIIYNYFLSCSSFSLRSTFNTNIRTADAGNVSMNLIYFTFFFLTKFGVHIYKFISDCTATEVGSSLNHVSTIKVKTTWR